VTYYAAFAFAITFPPILALSLLAQAFFLAGACQPLDQRLFQEGLSRAAHKASTESKAPEGAPPRSAPSNPVEPTAHSTKCVVVICIPRRCLVG
jgi:hypothetical protein